jgi:RNA ligase
MKYMFPIIRHIDDVLPHIEGRDEFIVAEREHYIVINYAVMMPDTFAMDDENDLGGAIRRECRGLIFGTDGHLISRPFHKFFNIGENEETRLAAIDLAQPHVIMEKMDGSMVRPIVIDGRVRLGTKMGVTDIAGMAEKYIHSRADCSEIIIWMETCSKVGLTPIFEYISPKNKIVIDYAEEDLVLLAIRHNETGNYLGDQNSIPSGLTVVPQYGSVEMGIDEYIAKVREQEGREGDIIRFADGHSVKIKNDWYVRIHKIKDRIRTPRHILDLVMNNELDDVLPILDATDNKTVHDFEDRLWVAYHKKHSELETLGAMAAVYENRKDVAMKFIPTLESKRDAGFVFGMLDGKDLGEMMLAHIKDSVTNTRKYEEMVEWLGM